MVTPEVWILDGYLCSNYLQMSTVLKTVVAEQSKVAVWVTGRIVALELGVKSHSKWAENTWSCSSLCRRETVDLKRS